MLIPMDTVGVTVRSETLEPYESATVHQKGYLTMTPFNLQVHIYLNSVALRRKGNRNMVFLYQCKLCDQMIKNCL